MDTYSRDSSHPLAHAVATALALAGAERADSIASVELEMLRVNDIEADDTSAARLRTRGGLPVTAAVTLAAEQPGEPYVLVHGSRGRITFWYKENRLLLQRAGHGPEEHTFGRTDLLENLLQHLRGAAELLVTPAATGAFMRLVEELRRADDPAPVDAAHWHTVAGESAEGRVVHGIDALVAEGAETLSLFSELGAPFASPRQAPLT